MRLLPILLFILLPFVAQAQAISPNDQDYQISIFFGGGSYYIDQEQVHISLPLTPSFHSIDPPLKNQPPRSNVENVSLV